MMHKLPTKHHHFALFVLLLSLGTMMFINPDFFISFFMDSDYSTIVKLLYYLPGFFVLMGIFEVILPGEFIADHLGRKSGFHGGLIAILLGSFLPGPVFLAFPVAAMLLRKGGSVFNAVLFISTWATFNITEEIFEIQFLGWEFFFLRFVITMPFLLLLAFLMEGDEWEGKEKHVEELPRVPPKN